MEILVVMGIIGLIVLVVFIEWKIGTAIGKTVTQGVGLILGLVLILLGFTIFIAIPIIMYSSKNKSDGKPLNLPTININKTNVLSNGQNRTGDHSKFIGKNYKDILLENNLNEYVDLFEKNKLTDITVISSLSDNDLEKLGITVMGDRKHILKIFSGT